MHPLEAALVAELVVHAAHRSVPEVVLRPQETPAGGLRARDLRLFQRRRAPPAARGAGGAGPRVLPSVLAVAVEDRVPDAHAVPGRAEPRLRDRQRPEGAPLPLLE